MKKIEEKVINCTRIFFEQEEKEKYYFKPENLDKFYSDGIHTYEMSGDENKTLSIEEYLSKVLPYL